MGAAGAAVGAAALYAGFFVVPKMVENRNKVSFYQDHFLSGTTVKWGAMKTAYSS